MVDHIPAAPGRLPLQRAQLRNGPIVLHQADRATRQSWKQFEIQRTLVLLRMIVGDPTLLECLDNPVRRIPVSAGRVAVVGLRQPVRRWRSQGQTGQELRVNNPR
jgi:hypothetical protein